LKKLLAFLLLFCAISMKTVAQTVHTFSALDTTNPFTGLNTFSLNPGNFGGAQNNLFTQSSVGTASAGTILGSFNTSGLATCCLTDALSVGMTVPSSAAGTQVDGIGVYGINNSSALGSGSGGGLVGVYSAVTCAVANGKCWGLNPVVSDSSGLFGVLYGIEDDVAIYNTTTIGEGILLNGVFHAQPTNYPAIAIVKPVAPSTGEWTDGLRINAGATSSPGFLAVNIGTQTVSSNSDPSQVIQFAGRDSGGTLHTAIMGASANGDVVLNPTSGRGVEIGGALEQTFSGRFASVCTMSSNSTCNAVLTAVTFSQSPICFVSPQNSGAAATYTSGGAYCVVSGGAATVTAASNNSGTWGVLVVGNPN
jgi:hypothetical protein